MQATTVREETAGGLSWLVVGLGIGLAVVLFAGVLGRMGLLGGRGETAVDGALVLTTEEMRFSQDGIRVRVGQTVVLQLDNADMYAHSFDVDALGVHVAMPANGQTTVRFTPTEPGRIPFYCGVPGHAAAGMVGELIVVGK